MAQARAIEQRTGHWIILAQVLWCGIALLALGLVVAGVLVEVSSSPARSITVRCDHCRGLYSETVPRQIKQVLTFWPSGYIFYLCTLCLVFALCCLVVGGVLIWRKADDRMARFAAFCLALLAASFCNELPAQSLFWQMLFGRIAYGSLICLFLFFCIFPTGRLTQWWEVCLAVASSCYWGSYFLFGNTLSNVFVRYSVNTISEYLLLIFFALLQFYRYKRISKLVQQQQTKWVVFGACSAALLVLAQQQYIRVVAPHIFSALLNEVVSKTTFFIALLLIPLSIGIAILRSRLWKIDIIIHRTLVYGVLSACVVGLYILIVGGLGTLLQGQGNVLISLLATGLIAVVFHPLRQRLQRAVNYLVYGKRYDPYQVLSGLSRQLESTLIPEAVLPTIVETVVQALKLPYAAITLKQEGNFTLGATYGQAEPEEALLHIALTYQGEFLGEMILARGNAGEAFSAVDQRLLEDLAHHAGVAVHSLRLSADIQRSRERLVMAREEERRRLRRDLHDGLGPQLASLMLLLTTVRKLLHRDTQAAETMLSEAMTYTQEAITDIRRLVYGLRPPALDDLGLLAALQENVRRYDASGTAFTLVAPEPLPALPAAVEVACYRIAQEALTNVINHAQAQHCLVQLSIGADLELEVTDDGRGLPAVPKPGLGLTTMSERACELGGVCNIDALAQGGTRVFVRLPLKLSDRIGNKSK